MNLKPYKFKPFFKTVIWGGNKIANFKGVSTNLEMVGESWEISGVDGHESIVDGGDEEGYTLKQLIEGHGQSLMGKKSIQKYGSSFPLLIKFIDAQQNLSVQVHPDDKMAQRLNYRNGKTEMWYIIDHEPKAEIMAGFKQSTTPEDYELSIIHDNIMDIIEHHTSRRGDAYYLPAGLIHAIGAGNLIVEVQQTSDLTYRIYDYNRTDCNGEKRELHTQLAKKALNFSKCEDCRIPSSEITSDETVLVSCDYFVTSRYIINGTKKLTLPDSFFVIICLDGSVDIIDENQSITPLRKGETTLIPACLSVITIQGQATLLTTHI